MTKRIVVCCDGTWNSPDQESPTNVVRLWEALAPCDAQGFKQLAFYHEGVGTGRFDRLRGGAFGKGFGAHVREAYRSIAENFELGDEIFLFGFSRGAFTVRSTAGLIRNSGVLRSQHLDMVDAAYRLYRRRDDPAHPDGGDAQRFRNQYSQETRIHFIGVWDTVGALGIPTGTRWFSAITRYVNQHWAFHDPQCSSTVDFAYQALAIDERRRQFAPTLWTKKSEAGPPTLEQVWFAGVHTNVGGGSQNRGLSDLALLWMMEKARKCGLAFADEHVGSTIHPNLLGDLRTSRTGLYRLSEEYIRPIGAGSTSHETVDCSARQRLALGEHKTPRYAPSNLTTYLDRQGND